MACFSFNASHDINVLEKTGYLHTEDKEMVVNTPGNYAFELNLFDSGILQGIYDKYKDYTDDDFIDYTYKEFPYYAINSEIAHKHLNAEQMEVVRQKDHRKTLTNHTLYTIGYEGRSLEWYLNVLLIRGVRVLCDVCKNA